MSEKSRIVVVGGGVVGMTMSMILAERGYSISLIERDTLGRGTTANTFAWANGTAKIESEPYHRLNALGVQFHNELANTHGPGNTGFHQSKAIEWADDTDTAALQALQHRYEVLKSWDYPVSWIDRAALQSLEPDLHFHDTAQGLIAHDDGWLDVRTWLGFVRNRLDELGATIIENCSAGEFISASDGTITGINTSTGAIACDQIIVASGIDTPDVLATLTGHEGFATRFPLARAPGLLVRAPAKGSSARLRHLVYTSALPGHFHIRPHPGARLLIGADDTDGEVSNDPGEEQIRHSMMKLLDRTAELIPDFPGSKLIDECTYGIGIRPVPADGQSLAGRMPGSDQVWIVVTHSGITLCPAIANLIADTLETGTVPATLQPFDPARLL